MLLSRIRKTLVWTFVCLGGLSLPAAAQHYSIDFQGPTMGLPDSISGVPITEGDILTPTGGPTPGIVLSGGFGPPAPGLGLPLHPPAVGHPLGVPGLVEVDALSYGVDTIVEPDNAGQTLTWSFSVDEFAIGAGLAPAGPNVTTEGVFGALEASADIFDTMPGMLPGPTITPGANTLAFDGDGFVPPGYPTLNLIEPHAPVPGPADDGDNLDALDLEGGIGSDLLTFPVYYSLDAEFPDPLEGFPANTASAVANGGFSGGDVLVTLAPGAGPVVYAPAFFLGLDLDGEHTDDLDALILHENGDGIFTPSQQPYDWLTGASDMLFFSVRRGSAIIGTPDSVFGIPIEEGDILFPAGPPGTPPGIWISAESLGLCTVRSCGPGPFGSFGDDLDALDVMEAAGPPTGPKFLRCDCNGDLTVGLTDVLFYLLWFFAGGATPPCENACDCNDDEILTITDGIELLNFLFLGGPMPPAPFPVCGPDPTPGPLTCTTPSCP